MTIKASTLRPGLLVSLKTSVFGNVKYDKRMIDTEHLTKDGQQKARWETERTVFDPEEHEAAHAARSKARVAITRVCANSAFGLLCPESDADELEAAIKEARAIADEFNGSAKLSRLYVYVITGRIAQDDVEAVRAINSEVRELLDDMAKGLKNLDVKAVRDAASRAKSIGQMLSVDAAAKVQIAVEAARESARKIVKAGETAATEIDKRTIRKIVEQRTAFLDLDEAKEIAVPKAEARAVDFSPNNDAGGDAAMARAASTSRRKARQIDL